MMGTWGDTNWYIVCFLDHLIWMYFELTFQEQFGRLWECCCHLKGYCLFDRVPLQFRCWREYNSCKDRKLNDIFVIFFGRFSPEWANRGVLRSTRPGMGTILQVMGGEVHPYQPAAGCYLVFNAALGNLKTPHHRSTENRTGVTKFTHSIWSQVQKDYVSTNYVGYQGTIIIYNYKIVLYSILYI